jgi:hypothetical protein
MKGIASHANLNFVHPLYDRSESYFREQNFGCTAPYLALSNNQPFGTLK